MISATFMLPMACSAGETPGLLNQSINSGARIRHMSIPVCAVGPGARDTPPHPLNDCLGKTSVGGTNPSLGVGATIVGICPRSSPFLLTRFLVFLLP